MILPGTADLAKASQRDLLDTLNALPAHEARHDAIRMQLAQRTLANLQRARIEKRRRAEVRSQVRLDRVTMVKAATVDLTSVPDQELARMVVTSENATDRTAALVEIGQRTMIGSWKGDVLPGGAVSNAPQAPAYDEAETSGHEKTATSDLASDPRTAALAKARRDDVADRAAGVLHGELKRRTAGG